MWVTKFFYLLLAGIAYLFFCLYLPQFSAYLLLSILLLPLGFFLAAHLCGRKLQAEISLSERETHLQESCCCTVSLKKSYLAAHRVRLHFSCLWKTPRCIWEINRKCRPALLHGIPCSWRFLLFPATADKSGSHCISAASMTASTPFPTGKRLNTSAVFTVSARCACTARHRCRNAAW